MFESHRPYRLENLFERSNLYIFDDGLIADQLDYLQEAFQGQEVEALLAFMALSMRMLTFPLRQTLIQRIMTADLPCPTGGDAKSAIWNTMGRAVVTGLRALGSCTIWCLI